MSCGPERDLNVGLLAFGFGVCPLHPPSDAFPGCAGLEFLILRCQNFGEFGSTVERRSLEGLDASII